MEDIAKNDNENKKIKNYPCFKYILKHLNRISQVSEFAKNYVATMHRRGVSEERCISGLRLMTSVPGACSIKKSDFFGVYGDCTDDVLYQQIITDAGTKEYKSCYEYYNQFSKAKGQGFDRKNSVCMICPFSNRYAGKYREFEYSLLHMLYSKIGDPADLDSVFLNIQSKYAAFLNTLAPGKKKHLPADFELISCVDLCEQWPESTPCVMSVSNIMYRAMMSKIKSESSLEDCFYAALISNKKIPSSITSKKSWKSNVYRNAMSEVKSSKELSYEEILDGFSAYFEYLADFYNANDSGIKRSSKKTDTGASDISVSTTKKSNGEEELSDILEYLYSLDYQDNESTTSGDEKCVTPSDEIITQNCVSDIEISESQNNVSPMCPNCDDKADDLRELDNGASAEVCNNELQSASSSDATLSSSDIDGVPFSEDDLPFSLDEEIPTDNCNTVNESKEDNDIPEEHNEEVPLTNNDSGTVSDNEGTNVLRGSDEKDDSLNPLLNREPCYLVQDDYLEPLALNSKDYSFCKDLKDDTSPLYVIENDALNNQYMVCEVIRDDYGDTKLIIYCDNSYYIYTPSESNVISKTIITALFNSNKVKKICFNAPALYAFSQFHGYNLRNCEGILTTELVIRNMSISSNYISDGDYYNNLDYIALLSHYNISKRYIHSRFAFNSEEDFQYLTLCSNEKYALGYVRQSVLAGMPLYTSVNNLQNKFARSAIKIMSKENFSDETSDLDLVIRRFVDECSFKNVLMGKALLSNFYNNGDKIVRSDTPGQLTFAIKTLKEVSGFYENSLVLSFSSNSSKDEVLNFMKFLSSSDNLFKLPFSIITMSDSSIALAIQSGKNFQVSFFTNKFRRFSIKTKNRTLSLTIK